MALETEQLSAAQRGKIRRLSQPKELAAEDEGGELNVVPFLDIIMNVLIFVLASVSVTFISLLDAENTPASESGSTTPDAQQTLQLTVILGADGVRVSAEGKLLQPGCDAPVSGGAARPSVGIATDSHGNPSGPDYAALTDCVKKLKSKSPSYAQEYQVLIAADWAIPYQTVINTMDAVRGNPPVAGAPPNDKTLVCDLKDGCLFYKVTFTAPAGQ
jgi:biopolymer transport protein TolR